MKFLIVCLIVCALALNWSFNCADTENNSQTPDIGKFKRVLRQQCGDLVQRINETWLTCRKIYPVPGDEHRMDMFSNAPTNEVDTFVSQDRRCLVGCTMRRMGLMTDDGFNVAEYMKQIKQLRLNYTSFDINEQPSEMRRTIFDVTHAQLPRLVRKDNCYHISALDPNQKYAECYTLIKSYEQAANDCKDLQDPDGDNCETSWIVLSCMIQSHRKRAYESPFYPIYPRNGYDP